MLRAVPLALVTLASLAACKDRLLSVSADGGAAMTDDAGGSAADDAIVDWSDTAKNAARSLVQSYGQPDDASSDALTWTARGPWKRTLVHRDEVAHAFPTRHVDVVEQVIDFKVPSDKVGAIAQFDGSVVVSRTRGEVTVWGPNERANFGLLNMTWDIATGAKNPDEARQAYADATTRAAAGEHPPMLERLLFAVPSGPQGDPDLPSTP